MRTDPTYKQAEIEANPTWHLAWVLSEIQNDNAPIGWGQYIHTAELLMRRFDIQRRQPASHHTRSDEG